MSVSIEYRCDACPSVVSKDVAERRALVTPDGWTVLGSWDEGYVHACSPECTALLVETRGLTATRPRSTGSRREEG